jgi:anti-anti-sigma factor
MEMQQDDLGDVKRVVLVGRLDTKGVGIVETSFGAAIVPNGKNTIVDISQVTFLASMGIRMLISTTRALSRKGGKLVMYGAGIGVKDVIESTALTDLIPLASNEGEALNWVAR